MISFLALPVVMIVLNATGALKGITWRQQEGVVDTIKPAGHDTTKVTFGIYDPRGELRQSDLFALEHIYISWTHWDSASVLSALQAIVDRNRWPLITVEPWSDSSRSEETLLKDIAQGGYDSQLSRIVRLLRALNRPVFLSWGHEMDQDLTPRYPWSNGDSADFISTWRYVHDFIESRVKTQIQWVWNPVVKKASLGYWPGDEYVDVVGMPVYSFPSWDFSYHGRIRTFEETLGEKYRLMSKPGKPIMIAEFGVAGSDDFRRYWMQEAFESFDLYPLVQWIVFHNETDEPGAWGADVPTPDWHLDPKFIEGFVSWYLQRR